jgi:hypothetical protein
MSPSPKCSCFFTRATHVDHSFFANYVPIKTDRPKARQPCAGVITRTPGVLSVLLLILQMVRLLLSTRLLPTLFGAVRDKDDLECPY